MKTPKFALATLAVASIGLAGVVLSPTFLPTAIGQDPQAPPQDNGGPGGGPPPQFGGPGGGGPGGGGGRRGQFGGGRAPFAFGTVTAVDPAARTITISPQFGNNGAPQTIQVSDSTPISSQVTATVADLKTGDHVQIQGIPTSISASSLTIGQNPLAAGGPGGFGGGFGGPGGGGRPGGFGGGQGGFRGPGAQDASAQATGTVTSTNPLTISLSEGVSVILKTDSKTTVTKYATVELSGIKVGDRVMSTGQAGTDGTFMASSVGVNMQMGGPGMGGGFGGRGGFGQGGRGRRGGQGGGQFGGGGAPPPVQDGDNG